MLPELNCSNLELLISTALKSASCADVRIGEAARMELEELRDEVKWANVYFKKWQAAEQSVEPTNSNVTPKCPQCGQRHTWKHQPA